MNPQVESNVNFRRANASAISRTNAIYRPSDLPSYRPPPHYRPSRGNKVLAERNQAVVPVGAWVEGGRDFLEHPSDLASLTEELQAEKRRQNEESLRRFQDEVRHRVAHQAHVGKKRQQKQNPYKKAEFEKRVLQQFRATTTHQLPAGKKQIGSDISRLQVHVRGAGGHRTMEQMSLQASKGTGQVRHRLAACRIISDGEVTSELPGGQWNREKWQRVAEPAVLEEEGEAFWTTGHACPLVQHNTKHRSVTFHHDLVLDQSDADPGLKSDSRVPRVLWPLGDQEEMRQNQLHLVLQRRRFMDLEREQVKENKQHEKHLQRIARIKTEKEQIRLEEEREMESLRRLKESRLQMEERELLILERLRLEEEERFVELENRKLEKKEKETARFMKALSAQIKERLSQEKMELPPLCCCGSFWDSHPDTCANNCVFHNNPKVYTQALQSALLSLDLQ